MKIASKCKYQFIFSVFKLHWSRTFISFLLKSTSLADDQQAVQVQERERMLETKFKLKFEIYSFFSITITISGNTNGKLTYYTAYLYEICFSAYLLICKIDF